MTDRLQVKDELDYLNNSLQNMRLAFSKFGHSHEALVDLFAQELEAFIQGQGPEAGAMPLDPTLFDVGRRH